MYWYHELKMLDPLPRPQPCCAAHELCLFNVHHSPSTAKPNKIPRHANYKVHAIKAVAWNLKCNSRKLVTHPTKSAARTDLNSSDRDGRVLCISDEGKGV